MIMSKKSLYLFDTHSLVFWSNKEIVSKEFIKFFDKQDQQCNLYVSSISFWEIALLVKKGKLEIEDIHAWKNELLKNTNIRLIHPSEAELIDSTLLPDYHNDPFDRALIAQTNHNNFKLVTKNEIIKKYKVPVFWI